MPYYKLVASGRPDVVVNEIVLSRDESGEPDQVISIGQAAELSEENLTRAQNVATSLGYAVVEAEEPSEEEAQAPVQPVGADVAGQSPVVESTPSGPSVSQQGEQQVVEQVQEEGGAPGAATESNPQSS
jgi:hypothetical protein